MSTEKEIRHHIRCLDKKAARLHSAIDASDEAIDRKTLLKTLRLLIGDRRLYTSALHVMHGNRTATDRLH